MADILDKADETAEVFLDAALRKRAPEGPPFTGRCHNCGDPVDIPSRWCDEDCQTDWQKRERKDIGPIYD